MPTALPWCSTHAQRDPRTVRRRRVRAPAVGRHRRWHGHGDRTLAAALQQTPALAAAARHAYAHAFSVTLFVIVGVTVLARAAVAWLLRPPPGTASATDEPAIGA